MRRSDITRDTLPPSPGRGSEGCQRHKVMGEKATPSTYKCNDGIGILNEALMGHKRHSGSAKLTNTTQFLLVLPLITNHALFSSVFSRMAILPFPSRFPKLDIIIEWVRTMVRSSEGRHNLIYSILNLYFTRI